MLLQAVWFYCPNGHGQLLDPDDLAKGREVYCSACHKYYMTDVGRLGETITIQEAFPNLRG